MYLKYLSTFVSKEQVTESVNQQTSATVIDLIKMSGSSGTEIFDGLVSLPAVLALKDHPTHSSLFNLLTIVAEKNLEDYTKFYSQNKQFIDQLKG